jgi:hypothetical protein
MNKSNTELEPRLSEYLKRKTFYENNNVIPTVPLEKQFSITKNDIKQIKLYESKNCETELRESKLRESSNFSKYTNDSDTDSDSNSDFNDKFVELPKKKRVNFEDESHLVQFKKSQFPTQNIYDPRLERIQEKMRREKEACKYRGNTANLQRSYDMYSRDFSSASSRDFEGEFNLDNIKTEINNVNGGVYEANSNFNTHELITPPSTHQYNDPPKIQYNQQLHYQRNNSKNNTLGSGYTSYRKPELPRFERQNVIDLDHKTNIVSNNCRKTDLNILYEGAEELTNAPLKNIDLENYVKYGYPTSKARSLGFENPFEHQFQYIDDDIQSPEHSVFDRPTASRLDNKTQTKFKQRDIY